MAEDPRSAARTWLARQMHAAWHDPSRAPFEDLPPDIRREYERAAEAILSAPGVAVEWRKLLLGPRRYDPRRAQVVVRLPGAYPKPGEEC